MTTTSMQDYTQRLERVRDARAFTGLICHRALGRPLAELPDDPAFQSVRKAATSAFLPGANDALLEASTAFCRIVEEGSLLGKMSGGTVPMPAYAAIVDVPTDPVGAFVAQMTPIPAALLTLPTTMTDAGKVASIYGIDKRHAQSAAQTPGGRVAAALQRAFVLALRRVEDRELLSATAAIVGTRPAGLLNSAPEFGSGSPADLESALSEMYAFVSNGAATAPYLITSPRVALWMATQHGAGGALFPEARVDGGSVAGIPLLTSPAATNRLVLVDASKLAVVDDGLAVDQSEQAAIQLSTTPTMGATAQVAGFQTNVVWVRLTRYLSWTLAADDAVAFTTVDVLAGSPS